MKRVTVIGGGTGSFVTLSGLKSYELDLAAIVTMMDSGGSTGRLRDQLGVLPPGDLRQCLVALSEAPELWRKLFLYRFEKGDLKGHNFGNIFLSTLEKITGNYDTVMETASYVLQTKGHVYPITHEPTTLCVEYENGTLIKGESNIEENNSERTRIKRAYLEPDAQPNPKAITCLQESDYIIIGPGDLYTSIVPVLIVGNVKKIIKESKAKIIYILNLMTKAGQTSGYKASNFLADLETYTGRAPDYVIAHKGSIPASIKEWYHNHDEHEVENDLQNAGFTGTIIEEDVINRSHLSKSAGDMLTRSVLRHDSEKITSLLMNIIS